MTTITGLEAAFASFSITDRDRSVEWVIPNVHRDDVHGIIQLGDSHIVSGSKDGSLVKCSTDGNVIYSVPTHSRGRPDYRKWVTAIARLSPTMWLHGTRDGMVDLWDNDFRRKRSWRFEASQDHRSKERNVDRITSLGTSDPSNPNACTFYVGQATQFSSMDTTRNGHSQVFSASENDWVYVLQPISADKMLVVTGTDLAMWENRGGWEGSHYIIKDRSLGPQRPYISSLTQLATNAQHIACAFFGGDVRIVDCERFRYVAQWKEHRDRVWSVVTCPVNPNLLATSADDATIKLWDIRVRNSVFTSQRHVGRVSSLLAFSNHLIAATCPSTPTEQRGASLICRDVRQLS